MKKEALSDRRLETKQFISNQDTLLYVTDEYLCVYVHGSVHHESMSITVQDAIMHSFIIFLQTALSVSDDTLIHRQEHIQTVITSGTGRTVFATVR